MRMQSHPEGMSGKGEGSRKSRELECEVVPSKNDEGTSRIGAGAGFSASSGHLESDKFCPQHRETGLRPFFPIPLLRNTPLEGV